MINAYVSEKDEFLASFSYVNASIHYRSSSLLAQEHIVFPNVLNVSETEAHDLYFSRH